ncbi:MAG: DNRLRE domain-containing protein [Methyloglobulus sp.]|nr:DNRLRE domain-containing protein [Methyloglobulus sp.]
MQRNLINHQKAGIHRHRQAKFQNGFILLPVVLAITLIAAIAFLMNREGAMNVNQLGGEMQSTQASLAAKAGMNHMLWQSTNANCTGYTNLATTSIGTNSYSATISPTSNSPVSIAATGTDANGASYTINRDRVKVYKPYTTVTLQLSPTKPDDKDALIASGNSTSNFGNGDGGVLNALIVFRNQLIQFDLSSIPSAANILSAQLQMYQKSGAGTANIGLYRVKQSWDEGTVTWKTYNGSSPWLTNGGDYDATLIASTSVTGGSNGTSNWEIAPLVQDWLTGKYPNNGMLLKTAGLASFTFASKEDATVPPHPPKLVIIYTCECGTCAKKVYWTDDTANKIQRSDEDGSHVEDVVTGLNRPTGLDFDATKGYLYWTNNLQIQRSTLDGTHVETLYNGALVTMDIKVDSAGGKMYWTHDNGTSRVMSAKLDGTSSQTINTTLNRPTYLSLDTNAGYIYTTNFGNGSIARMNLGGTSVTNLVSAQGTPVGSAVDPINGKVYWSAGSGGNWLRRSNLNGSSIETIVTGLSAPQDIAYDADTNRIYWTDGTAKKVQRSSPDGSNVVTIVSSGLTRPRGIILVDANLRSVTLNSVADTDISEPIPGTNYGTTPYTTIYVGKNNSGKQYKGLIKFDVSTIPTSATITSATLRLNETTSTGSGSYNIGLYKIKTTWVETTATWSNFSAAGNYDTTQQAVTSVATVSTGFKEWALPNALINAWIGAPASNYGLAIVCENCSNNNFFQFAAKENTTAASRPQLVVNYTMP